MHRSRLPVLVIFAAVAACSTRDDSQGTEVLSEDPTLAARLEIDRDVRQTALPTACSGVTVVTQPTAVAQAQAKELTLKAQDAQMQGDLREASTLLRRALELDGTSKSAAYHLGRTSEALGERTVAMSAYCRYLALTPTTTESAEARERVATLSTSQTQTQIAAGSVSERAPTRRRVSTAAPVHRLASESRASRSPRVTPARTERPATVASSAEQPVAATSTDVGGTASSVTTGSDAVASARPVDAVEQAATAPRAARRGPSRAQGAIVGAATGAIIGAATGRSVKGAVIGGAAGGILGAAVGPSIRAGRGFGS